MDTETIYIERLNGENIKDLRYLLSLYSANRSTEYYLRKYDTGYTGKSYIGFLAYNADRVPLGYYGGIPCKVTNGKESYLACQSADTITNPLSRKKGLFLKLLEKANAMAKEEGLKVIFGFPNANSAHGFFNKSGWTKVGNFNEYFFTYKNLNLYNIFNRNKYTKLFYKLYFFLVYPFIKTKPLKAPVFKDPTFQIEKSQGYYEYKKFEKSFFVRIGKFKFWCKFEDGIIIGEIEEFDPSNEIIFFNSLRKLANILGVKKISIICMSDSFFDSILRKTQNPKEGIAIGYLPYDENIKMDKWHFTWSDSDTF
jgi:hypothetical protein